MPIDKNYLSLQFRDKIHQKNGTEFQSFFEDIMQKAFPDFQKIRPYGNQGDGGNDGYRPTEGIYYQVYAPRDPKEKEADAAQKLKEDFKKLKTNWDPISEIKTFYFVFNDKGIGVSIEIEKALSELKKSDQNIDFKKLIAKDLEETFFTLKNDQILALGFDINLVDYMIGVEAGLDNNGRKNRSGHAMEDIVEVFISDLCKRKKLKYLKEANAERIKAEFGYDVPVDKSSRRYDFIIDTGKEPLIIETNFYGVGGSKLKSTAGEYRNLFDVLQGKYKFIWITDGPGWKSTTRPLRETFNHNEYLFNLNMLEKGILGYFGS